MLNGRRGVVFRSPDGVAETVADAVESGYEMVHIAFDPGREGERYYRHLFPLIRERGLRVRCYFECFSLPAESFLRSFADFCRESSPGCGGLGYYITDYLEGGELDAKGFESLLREAKYLDHCSMHPNHSKASVPFWGRLYCRYLS